mmetsp:Transcript_32564/g.70319  ORF Transcript_32564/g.70319 Transcript_32564/m.70319 type:complete len:221 (-) Transcript_32564:358-1020(-)
MTIGTIRRRSKGDLRSFAATPRRPMPTRAIPPRRRDTSKIEMEIGASPGSNRGRGRGIGAGCALPCFGGGDSFGVPCRYRRRWHHRCCCYRRRCFSERERLVRHLWWDNLPGSIPSNRNRRDAPREGDCAMSSFSSRHHPRRRRRRRCRDYSIHRSRRGAMVRSRCRTSLPFAGTPTSSSCPSTICERTTTPRPFSGRVPFLRSFPTNCYRFLALLLGRR